MPAWISDPDTWDGRLPVGLAAPCATVTARHVMLRRLAARALDLPDTDLAIEHPQGRAPRVRLPAGTALCCSSASRAGWAALALSEVPVGIDIEAVEPASEVPWRVLHPEEGAILAKLEPGERARAFARLWTAKEATLKACGIGLAAEPSTFRVRLMDEERAIVEDPLGGPAALLAESRWVRSDLVVTLAERPG